MEFQIEHKRRGAYAGASKRKFIAKGNSGREYEIEQTGEGWGVDVSNRDYFVMRVFFGQLKDAKASVEHIENGTLDWTKPKHVVRGVICFECGGRTPEHERKCEHCGTLKPWLDYKG